jgi:hypothetical protein
MKSPAAAADAFSLVELTLAIGVAAFCLLTVFALLPIAALTNRNATSQTAATNIAALIIADLRAVTKTPGTWSGSSPLFCITLGTQKTIYFDSQSQCYGDVAGSTSPCGGPLAVSPPRYRANIAFPSAGNLTYVQLKITWPAAADPTRVTPSGSVDMFAALDRN